MHLKNSIAAFWWSYHNICIYPSRKCAGHIHGCKNNDAGLNWAICIRKTDCITYSYRTFLFSTSPMQEIVASFRKLKMPKKKVSYDF